MLQEYMIKKENNCDDIARLTSQLKNSPYLGMYFLPNYILDRIFLTSTIDHFITNAKEELHKYNIGFSLEDLKAINLFMGLKVLSLKLNEYMLHPRGMLIDAKVFGNYVSSLTKGDEEYELRFTENIAQLRNSFQMLKRGEELIRIEGYEFVHNPKMYHALKVANQRRYTALSVGEMTSVRDQILKDFDYIWSHNFIVFGFSTQALLNQEWKLVGKILIDFIFDEVSANHGEKLATFSSLLSNMVTEKG